MSELDALVLLIAGPIIVVTLTTVFLIVFLRKRRKTKMYTSIEMVLENYVKRTPDSKLDKVYLPEYDYILQTSKSKTYIMIVPNFSCGELFLSSSTKWSIKKTYEDSYSKFVPRVDKLARFDPPYEGGLQIRRMYIIYPLAKSILRYINDCEMEFIHFDTDINGANIVTYLELKDDKIVF